MKEPITIDFIEKSAKFFGSIHLIYWMTLILFRRKCKNNLVQLGHELLMYTDIHDEYVTFSLLIYFCLFAEWENSNIEYLFIVLSFQ